MKKFIVLLLSIVLTFGFVACGKEDNEPTAPNETVQNSENNNVSDEKTKTGCEIFFKEENYSVKAGNRIDYPNNVYTVAYEYDLKEDSKYEMLDKIIVESTTIKFRNTTVKELCENGWTLVGGNQMDTMVKSNIITNALVKSPNGKYATIYAINNTAGEIKFAECVVKEVEIEYNERVVGYDGLTEASNFVYAEQINSLSTPADVIGKLGEPQYITITDTVENGEYKDSVVHLSYVNKDSSVSFDFAVVDGVAKMTEVRFSA